VNEAVINIQGQQGGAATNHSAAVGRWTVRKGLRALRPEIPWTHLIDLNGCPTISRGLNDKWLKKAEGLHRLGEITLQLCRSILAGQTLVGKSVLDLGCGEAGHAIMFAQAGAGRVLGIEGRPLTVERARFATGVLGLHNVEIRQKDVRTIDADDIGAFDVVLCSGILHHIEQEQWWPFLRMVGRVTSDLAIFYTHVPNEELQAEHKLRRVEPKLKPLNWRGTNGFVALYRRLRGGVPQSEQLDGYLFREHSKLATAEEKASKMRASLDNSESFWATEEALVNGLQKAGFQMVLKVQSPHMFKSQRLRDTRQIIVAKKIG
jgi:cyclopropane fatty-acyl-phospholipid synthase-like methyltransferase